MDPYKVYIKIDSNNKIIAINSSAFISDFENWIEIDSGYGDKYHHAQGNYFPKPIYDNRGIPQYLYTPENPEQKWRERTPEEMNADYKPLPTPPSDAERITNLENALSALQEGIDNV